jgi:hypothetical protein
MSKKNKKIPGKKFRGYFYFVILAERAMTQQPLTPPYQGGE